MRFTAHCSQPDPLQVLIIEIPITERYNVRGLLDRAEKKHGGFLTLDLSLPKRPRTTGPHSQNSCVWGWCEEIAEALDMDKDRVYSAMKRMAVGNGYPTHMNELDGTEEPKSQTEASVEECSILLETIWQYAGANGLSLTPAREDSKLG